MVTGWPPEADTLESGPGLFEVKMMIPARFHVPRRGRRDPQHGRGVVGVDADEGMVPAE